MDIAFQTALRAVSFLRIKSREPLSAHSTFRIGGPCETALFPETKQALIACVRLCRAHGIPYYVIGNGSDMLFDDRGFSGAVIFTEKMRGISAAGAHITCECGVPLALLCRTAKENALAGLAFACGIPGTVGGAVVMNAGAFGGEIADVFEEATVYDPQADRIFTLTKKEARFSYRRSIFKEKPFLLLSCTFSLQTGNSADIAGEMEANMKKRQEKQPLDFPSAGSAFKRPEGHYAAELIEKSGLRGYAVGGAQVSEKHAGFIINKNNASCADVMSLIQYVQKTVLQNSGILLEPEIIYLRP